MEKSEVGHSKHGRPPAEPARVECIPASQISITDEAKYIAQCAVACDARLVSLMGLVLFSTETGDAWMLDIEDGYAMRLTRGGVPQKYCILETTTSLQIPWDSRYLIEGERFVVTDNHGQITEYLGFPVQAIAHVTGASEVETSTRNDTRQSATSQRATSISKAEKARRKRMRKTNKKKRK